MSASAIRSAGGQALQQLQVIPQGFNTGQFITPQFISPQLMFQGK